MKCDYEMLLLLLLKITICVANSEAIKMNIFALHDRNCRLIISNARQHTDGGKLRNEVIKQLR